MTIHINLLSWREVKQQQRRQKTLFLLLGGMLCLLFIVIGFYFYLTIRISVQEKRNSYLREELKKVDCLSSKEEHWLNNKKKLLKQAEHIKQLHINGIEVVKMLDALPRWVPDEVFLTNFAQAGNQVLLQGKAKNHELIALMVRNINQAQWLKSLQLSLIQNESSLPEQVGFGLRAINPVWHHE